MILGGFAIEGKGRSKKKTKKKKKREREVLRVNNTQL